MKKIMQLEKMNYGSFPKERMYVNHLLKINGATIDLSNDHIKVVKDNKVFIDSSVESETEVDFLSRTDTAKFSNGQMFKIVRASGTAAEILSQIGGGIDFTVASQSSDGYAAQFKLVDAASFDPYQEVETSKPIQSKAEVLVQAAEGMISTDQAKAKEFLIRFMEVLKANPLDFLRFESTQRLIQGYIFAFQLGLHNQEQTQSLMSGNRLNFRSGSHIRKQNGQIVRAHNTSSDGTNEAARGIVIEPNFIDQVGYVVYLYNAEQDKDMTETNLQMTPKAMVLSNVTENEISLAGHGQDHKGQDNSDFGLHIDIQDNVIQKITLQLLDRGVELIYLS
jgi:hypothetical protein